MSRYNMTTASPGNHTGYLHGTNYTVTEYIDDTHEYVDSEDHLDDFDYYSIEDRVRVMLMRPHEIIAILIGTISIVLNVVILGALYQVRKKITTHYRLIISLAVSDLLVGGSVLFHIVNKVFNPLYAISFPPLGPYSDRLKSRCAFIIIKALNTTGLNITLMNLMMMALDHYVAILKPLQYPLIMRKGRVVAAILIMWAIATILGFSDFLSAITEFSRWRAYGSNYCEVVWITKYQDEYTVFAIALICLGIMIFCYSRIYMKVHRRQTPGARESIPRTTRATQRATKALITTLLNLGSFIIAWLPLCLYQITLIIMAKTDPEGLSKSGETLAVVDRYIYNLLILNAIADPIIYTVRMREVRIGFWRLCSCCPYASFCQPRLPRSNSFSATQSLKVLYHSQTSMTRDPDNSAKKHTESFLLAVTDKDSDGVKQTESFLLSYGDRKGALQDGDIV